MKLTLLIALMTAGMVMLSVHAAMCVDELANKYGFDQAATKAKQTSDAAAAAPATDYARMIEYRASQSRYIFYECILLSIVAIVSLSIVVRYISVKSGSASHIVSASGLVLIIFGTILLVLLTDAESQLTAGIGVMGAIAGYLFGKMHGEDARMDAGK